MLSFLLPLYIATTPPPPVYTWCTFQMIQTNSREMISTAYGMGNVPSGTDLTRLCQAFYTRDIRAEDKPLELIFSTRTQSQDNPDVFWLANTWRRPLTATEIEQYDCLLNKGGGLALSNKIFDLMPTSPDAIRIPALIISAINSVNSPIMKYAAVVMYSTGVLMRIMAGLVKAWKLAGKRYLLVLPNIKGYFYMLLRFAKISGGLRILVFETAPIIATSVGLLSVRTVAYFVEFGLGSIASILLPIVAVLVSLTGCFGAEPSTAECEAYRAQMRAIDNRPLP